MQNYTSGYPQPARPGVHLPRRLVYQPSNISEQKEDSNLLPLDAPLKVFEGEEQSLEVD